MERRKGRKEALSLCSSVAIRQPPTRRWKCVVSVKIYIVWMINIFWHRKVLHGVQESLFLYKKNQSSHLSPLCITLWRRLLFFPPDDRFTTLVYDGLSMANAKLRCPPRPTDRQTDRERRDSIAGCKYGQREKIISTCLAPNFLLS
jgi:hypothetical protein